MFLSCGGYCRWTMMGCLDCLWKSCKSPGQWQRRLYVCLVCDHINYYSDLLLSTGVIMAHVQAVRYLLFCVVGHITGRHDSHRSLTACPLYHNMSADECKACSLHLLHVYRWLLAVACISSVRFVLCWYTLDRWMPNSQYNCNKFQCYVTILNICV